MLRESPCYGLDAAAPRHVQCRASPGVAAVQEVGGTLDWGAGGHPGSACFGGSAGMATFVERADRAGDAALELGPPPALADVPGRLRYGWRLWQARRHRRSRLVADVRRRVQSAGLAGVAAMVILNFLYYTGAFLLLWTLVLQPPRGLGVAGAARRIGQALGIVYVASISSKVPRAAAMLLLAPGLNRAMTAAQHALGLTSQRQVFALLLAVCLGAFFTAVGVGAPQRRQGDARHRPMRPCPGASALLDARLSEALDAYIKSRTGLSLGGNEDLLCFAK
ncbi:hypothetical protein WJX81_002710 [Elliptochloris bilobata]|uniref:Uncharacterized protein n=1 Tax=Elliptochloris bilobata TaxID=381761 RepID=A0AAW1QA23_9CHLO